MEKCGSSAWTEIFDMARKIREGETKWEELNLDDVDVRLKWAGLFHRGKRTPGKFMMRLKVRLHFMLDHHTLCCVGSMWRCE